MRKLTSMENYQVSGAETTLINRADGLHIYMTRKDEQFEFNNIVFRPDGSVSVQDKSAYHFQVIDKMLEENGQFHARIWK